MIYRKLLIVIKNINIKKSIVCYKESIKKVTVAKQHNWFFTCTEKFTKGTCSSTVARQRNKCKQCIKSIQVSKPNTISFSYNLGMLYFVLTKSWKEKSYA